MIEDILNNLTINNYGRTIEYGDRWSSIPKLGINRLWYVHSGSAAVYVNSREIEIKPGRIYLYPRNIEFNVEADLDTGFEHTFFDFNFGICSAPDVIELKKDENPLIFLAMEVLLYMADKYPMFPLAKRNEYYESVKLNIANIMLYILELDKGLTLLSDARISKALIYIQNNIFKDITVNEIAEYVNLEANYFIKLFKKNMNISPYRYIKNYRLNFAISLIKNGESVSNAAEFAGYDSLGTFTNTIKSYTGLLPSEIRDSVK